MTRGGLILPIGAIPKPYRQRACKWSGFREMRRECMGLAEGRQSQGIVDKADTGL